jgi:hypothetical protein
VAKKEAIEDEMGVRKALPNAMLRAEADNQKRRSILARLFLESLKIQAHVFLKKNGGMAAAVLAGLAVGVSMVSCVGVRADAVIQANGAGTITMEYGVSQPLDAMGKLDGNERWLTVPVGEADFRRTIERLDGVELVSFASKASKTNAPVAQRNAAQSMPAAAVVNTVKLKFDAIDSLLGFLDATGGRASFATENGKNRLTLVLAPKGGGIDPDLLALFASVSSGYTCAFTVSVPLEGSLSVRDADGKPLAIPDAEVKQGDPLSFSVPIGTLLSIEEGVVLEIIWG